MKAIILCVLVSFTSAVCHAGLNANDPTPIIEDLESGKLQLGAAFDYLVKSSVVTTKEAGSDHYAFAVFRRRSELLYVLFKNDRIAGAWFTQPMNRKETFYFMDWDVFREYAAASTIAVYEG